MKTDTVLLFTHNGMGHAPQELQLALAKKFLTLTLQSQQLPARILFYTEGVQLACQGSPVLDELKQLQDLGVELVLCQTCLKFLNLEDSVLVGIVGGMGDILESLQASPKVISL